MPQLNRIQQVKEIPYPPAPWKMNGQLWMSAFKTDSPVPLPAGLKHFLDPNTLIVTLVRYLEGTLTYDELVIGTLARLGSRIGIYVDYIWVDSLESVWGGRRIWGLPKNLATFTWQGETVSVSDEEGPIATLSVDKSAGHLPWLRLPTPGIGQLENGRWAYTIGDLWAKLGNSQMHIEAWSKRFSYHPGDTSTFSMAAKPFKMRVPAAKALDP